MPWFFPQIIYPVKMLVLYNIQEVTVSADNLTASLKLFTFAMLLLKKEIKNYGFGVYFSSMNIQWFVISGDNSSWFQYFKWRPGHTATHRQLGIL